MKNKKNILLSFILLFSFTLFIAQTASVQSFHDTKGNIDVNGAGQLQFTLPIALPPSIKNVTPEINLVYTSGSSNGLAGYGWNISGISSISRIGKNIERDGEMKSIQLDYSDLYNYNGQRLILKSGEYGKDGAEYVTEKFSNIKIKSIGAISGQIWNGPEFWEITFSDGSQAWYGSTGTGNSPARTPIDYNIVKWKDRDGNYITYNYLQDTGKNVAVISSIKWGGNEPLGKAHFNEIDFNYNSADVRQLVEQSFVNGVSLIQDKLLNNIVVKTNSAQYKKYDIKYKSDDTKYQFVEKIQEYNSNNQAANPIEFFQDENISQTSHVSNGTWISFPHPVLNGDFRGTNSLDFILYKNASGSAPAGYYLQFEDDTLKYYLGSENVYTGAIPVNIKEANNFVSSRQGFVSYSINPVTKDLTLTYYLIDLSKTVNISTQSYPNALYLVGTKVIPGSQWDESVNTSSNNPYNVYNKTTTIRKLIQYDIDADGVSEILIEKNNNVSETWCSNQRLDSQSENMRPPLCSLVTAGYDASRYIVIKQQDNSFPFFQFDFDKSENIYFGDFNGDGINEIGKSFSSASTNINGETVPGNILKGYNLKKNTQGNLNLTEVFSANYSGVSSHVQIGDFNGDGISDLFARTNVNNHYIINLNDGKNFLKTPYFNDFYSTESYTSSQNGNYSVAKVIDINADGKSDIVNFSTNYNIASTTSASSSFTIKVSESQGFLNGKIEFIYNQTVTNNYNAPFLFREILGIKQGGFYIYYPTSNQNVGQVNHYSHYSDLQKTLINRIVQGGITTLISYNGGYSNTVGCSFCYQPIKNEPYPLTELRKVNSHLVSRLYEAADNVQRYKDFRYRGIILNLHNKKTIGFRQLVSSSWYSQGFENTKIWSGVETDPLQEGALIKEWSIRTNNEEQIFPVDISESNNQLLSFKSITYLINKIVNGQVVTAVSDSDKPRVVTAIVPVTTKGKDFLTNTVTESTTTYGDYYLPVTNITKINNNYAVTTTNNEYYHNPSGTGTSYFIGRPKSQTEIMQAYNDTKSSKNEYTYDNNRIKTIKIWNNDNTGYLQESFNYDGFGHITEKVITNSVDGQAQTTATSYDSKGRFALTKTDNIGLVNTFTYNDFGNILTQTDPLQNTITNTYDSWGKLLNSDSSLSGITSYLYERDSNSNITITQNNPDGNVIKTYTNKLGQQYKVTTKAFENGQFVSKETQYDALGRKTKESEPYFEGQSPSQWNIVSYNDNFFPAKVTTISSNGKQTETSISGLTTVIQELNGYGRTTSKTVDALGNTLSSTDTGGTINFRYNALGKQIEAKYGSNAVTTEYDAWGRKSEFHDPSNGIYNYEYNGFGQILKLTSPKGEKLYTYNSLGQLVLQTEISSDGVSTNKTINFDYDGFGRITSKTGTSNGKSFSTEIHFDTNGRINALVENSNDRRYIQNNFSYDNASRVLSYSKTLISPAFTTTVTIDHKYNYWNGDLLQLSDHNTGGILWELERVNAKGQALRSKLGEATINNDYDNNGYLTGTNHSSPVKPGILQISYSFDAIKNELKNRITGGDFSIAENFEYDNNNRLTEWTNPVAGQNSMNSYDQKGRIIDNDQIGKIKYDNNTKIYQATGAILNPAGEQNYNNDLTQYIGYNENNDPVYIDGIYGDVAFQYGLTAMRQRVTYGGNFDFNEKKDGRYTKLYSENGSFEVTIDNDTKTEKHIIYVAGNPYDSNIIYVKSTKDIGSYNFLHKDYLGTILSISNQKGNKIEQRHFDAWGNLTHLQLGNSSVYTNQNEIRELIKAQPLLIDRGYTSHEHFMEVGIIHMNGRLYDPLLRRFLNADEHIQDPVNTQNYNKYSYVLNNPMIYNDLDGEFWAWAIGTIVGSYLSGVQANNGNWNPVKWDWKNTWTAVVGGGIAGAAIGGGIQNIATSGTKFIANSVVGSVGGIFNGLANGQNIFKSALIGFSGINYTFNINNDITSTDGINTGYKYIISPDYNSDLGEMTSYNQFQQEDPLLPWDFDKKGEELMNHWLRGSGKNLKFVYDKSWSDYMKNNGFILDRLKRIAKSRAYFMFREGKITTSEVSGNHHFEIDNSYNTGYGMLHGTQYFSYNLNGNFDKINDSYIFKFSLKWTDQINHNSKVVMDRFFNSIARSAGNPKDYWITIIWTQTLIIKKGEWID